MEATPQASTTATHTPISTLAPPGMPPALPGGSLLPPSAAVVVVVAATVVLVVVVVLPLPFAFFGF